MPTTVICFFSMGLDRTAQVRHVRAPCSFTNIEFTIRHENGVAMNAMLNEVATAMRRQHQPGRRSALSWYIWVVDWLDLVPDLHASATSACKPCWLRGYFLAEIYGALRCVSLPGFYLILVYDHLLTYLLSQLLASLIL